MFDEFGAVDVCDENGSDEGFVDFLHDGEGAVAVATDDDAVGVHEVFDGAAFAEEFGVGDDVEFDGWFGVAADGLGDAFAGSDGDGAFVDDDAVAIEADGDFSGDFFDVAEVDAAVWLGWGGDGDEDDFAEADAFFCGGGEVEAVGDDVFANELFEAWFVDGDFAFLQGLDFIGVVIDA